MFMWLEIKAIVVLNHGQNPTKAKIDKAMAHVCFVNSDTYDLSTNPASQMHTCTYYYS